MAEDTPGVIIGRRLRALRQERLLSAQDLATQSGTGEATIRRIETGGVPHPRRTTVDRLARALAVSAEDLIGPTPPVEFLHMSGATAEQRLRALGAADEAEVRAYRRSIFRAVDTAGRWSEEAQDPEDQEILAAYIAFLHTLLAETDPFDVVPPTKEQRAVLAAHSRVATPGAA